MSSTTNLQTGDGWTHLRNLETLEDLQVDGNLTVLGTANFVTNESQSVITAITTIGNGTLTAAGIAGGYITRTGPVAAYSDATDTAVAIIAAIPGIAVNETFCVWIKNATAFTQTITAGVGVTLTGTLIIPAFSDGIYLVKVLTTTTVSMTHIVTVPISNGTNLTAPTVTTISTGGAGTLTAAAFNGSIIARGGSQSGTPFTDTTDTAANIIAAAANLINKIGTAIVIRYVNNTNAVATITGGTGVTVSAITAVPAGMTATYLLTYTAAATMTLVGVALSPNLSTIMALAGSSSGQTFLQPSAAASGTLTLPAATDTLVGKATIDTLTNKTLTDFIDSGDKVPSALMNIVSTTTLVSVPGLSVAVTAAGTYSFKAYLTGTSTTNGGLKVAIANSGTTTTSTYTGKQFNNGTTNAATTTSTMGNAVGAATTVYTDATIEGVVVIANAGNLTVQAAQNVSHADTTTVTVGSYFKVSRVS